MDPEEEAKRKFTFALMVVTAFVGLLIAVGYLSLEFGNDLARTAGIVLMFIPILLVAGGLVYLAWRLDPVRAVATVMEGIDRFLARWRSEEEPEQPTKSKQCLPERPGQAERTTPATPIHRWVQLGPNRHQQLTPDQMVHELERLAPLAARFEEAERAAQRSQETVRRLEAQAEAARLRFHEQIELVALERRAELVAAWHADFFGEGAGEVPTAEEFVAAIKAEMERLRQQRAEVEREARHLADDLASREQHLNTARARLEAVREALALGPEIPLIEGAKVRQGEVRALREQLAGLEALRAERDRWKLRAEVVEETATTLQAEVERLRLLAEDALAWQEVHEEELIPFWPTVQLEGEAYLASQRRQRRLLQRLRAAGILLVHRTAVPERGAPYPLESETPLPQQEVSPDARFTEGNTLENEVGEGGASSTEASTVPSTVSPVRQEELPVRQSSKRVRQARTSVRQPVRSATTPGRQRRRRPSMGHY